ncbi:hypothetical protein ABNQ39_11305 [Azospirillum sp. A26]|uniref:hypothetical protein n=1 Tax=Azospirillum sp. A26 TaxID=3160607 RepID=UPI00366C5A34
MTDKANSPQSAAGDLCYGLKAIAAHLGVDRRHAKYLHESGRLPTFTMEDGRTVCALRSKLNSWLAAVANAGREGVSND